MIKTAFDFRFEFIQFGHLRPARWLVRLLCIAFGVAGFAGLINPAAAQTVFNPTLSFCNRTLDPVSVAIAFDRAQSQQITSKGWFKVPACGCRTILRNTPLKATEVFLLANRGGVGNILTNPRGPMCVRPGTFEFSNQNANAQACRAAGGSWSLFRRFDTGGGARTFTLRRPGQCNLMDDQ